MGNGKKLVIIVVSALVGVGVCMYLHKQKEQAKMIQTPIPSHMIHGIHVHSEQVGAAPHEDFAFSDIKGTYVSGGHSEMQLASDATSENIGGILTNTKDAKGQVVNVGMNLMNEFALGQRDGRVVESYYMNEQQYGAGTPNYRKLAGWY